MVHCEGEEEEEERLCSRLLCHAHLNLSVTGIETGYSRDIHGEVSLRSPVIVLYQMEFTH